MLIAASGLPRFLSTRRMRLVKRSARPLWLSATLASFCACGSQSRHIQMSKLAQEHNSFTPQEAVAFRIPHGSSEGVGIYRSGTGLGKVADKLRELQERFRDVAIEDDSLTFNTELTAALELSFMLDVAETVIQCALRREESRGAHQRSDFPDRDDERFLAHSLIYRDADGYSRLEDIPVTITRWPPAERTYGN